MESFWCTDLFTHSSSHWAGFCCIIKLFGFMNMSCMIRNERYGLQFFAEYLSIKDLRGVRLLIIGAQAMYGKGCAIRCINKFPSISALLQLSNTPIFSNINIISPKATVEVLLAVDKRQHEQVKSSETYFLCKGVTLLAVPSRLLET